jgi:hypothetical protein
MLITSIDLVNQSRVLLLEDFFPEPVINQLLELCDTYPDPVVWTVPYGFDHTTLRRSYSGNSAAIAACENWLSSAECVDAMAAVLGHRPQYNNLHLWCDVEGVDSLAPHKEQGGSCLAQFFITRTEHSYAGTTIYNDDQRLLFQMPYRNNYGWFIDDATRVMHGREHAVPAGIKRFSMLTWWQL